LVTTGTEQDTREITAGLQQGFIVVNHGGFIPEVSLNICLIADVKRRAERVRSEWAERGRDQSLTETLRYVADMDNVRRESQVLTGLPGSSGL